MNSMRSLFILLLLAGVGACAAEDPGLGEDGNGDVDGGVDDEPDAFEGVRLTIDGVAPQTYWDTVPVRGQGPKDGTVIVMAGSSQSVPTASDGSFCVDVPLALGTTTTIEIYAIDEFGERSDTQSFEVEQSGEPPEPGEPTPPKNIALGGLPTASTTVYESEGEFSAMTDGILSSNVLLGNPAFSDDWLILRLPVGDGVERIRVYTDIECPMEEYYIHSSRSRDPELTMPPEVTVDQGDWVFRGHYGNEDGLVYSTDCSTSSSVCQEYSFDSQVTNSIGIHFVSGDCSSWGRGRHRVQEIQAWTPEGVAPPTISAPSCTSGG